MKPTKYFNITVPELGDKPNITQVSNAISNLEDALAGTTELMDGTVNNKVLTLVSSTRTTKRTSYHKGMSVLFIAKATIDAGGVTSVKIDDLAPQSATINFRVDIGETAMLYYDGAKFIFQYMPIPKSASVTSTSTSTVATSSAAKQAYDKGVEALNKANIMTPNGGYGGTANDLAINKADKSIVITAGNGLTGGGDISTSRTINVASADDGITVNADNIKLNIIDSVTSTSKTRPASGSSVKQAYDKGVEALGSANAANTNADSKVSKSGDTMTGSLTVNGNIEVRGGITNFIAPNNYGYMGRTTDGKADYMLYMNTSNEINLGYGGRDVRISGTATFNSNPRTKNGYPGFTFENNDGLYNAIGVFGGDDKIRVHRGSQQGAVYTTGFKPTATDVGALPLSGGTVTGQTNFSSDVYGKRFIGANNFGFMNQKTDGTDIYSLLISDTNKLHLGWANTIPIYIDSSDVTFRGGATFQSSIDMSAGDIRMTGGGKIYSYHNDLVSYRNTRKGVYASTVNIGLTDEDSNWLLRCDNDRNIYDGYGRKLLTSGNTGFSKELLFSGALAKTKPGTLTKSITDFDLIYVYCGDGEDNCPSIYLPENMMAGTGASRLFQCNYADSNGGATNIIDYDTSYFRMNSANIIEFIYGFTNNRYLQDITTGYVNIVGIKFKFGTV